MKIAAARAIAASVTDPVPELFIPSALDSTTGFTVGNAVKAVYESTLYAISQ